MIFITYTQCNNGSIDENVFDWDNKRWDSYNSIMKDSSFSVKYDPELNQDLLLRDAFTGVFSPPVIELVMLENDSYESEDV